MPLPNQIITLYRPVGQMELELIRAAGFRAFPPRLAHQPIFYPVATREYAEQIAREWNTKDPISGFIGYVLRFHLPVEFLSRYPIQTVGGKACQEYWIPAEDLEETNANLIGRIEIIGEFQRDSPA
jgi:hypothetical protein